MDRAATLDFWQVCKKGHFTGAPTPFSIFQNPAKDQALATLPPMAALMDINCPERQI